jgi:hypothetical protein
MISRFFTITTLSLMLAVAPFAGASAHETAKGANGGAVVDAAGHHVEFVPAATELTFFLTGHQDEPIASAAAKMKAITQVAGKTAQLELTPVEPNKLVGKLAAPLVSGAKVVMSGTLSDGHSLQARFVVP